MKEKWIWTMYYSEGSSLPWIIGLKNKDTGEFIEKPMFYWRVS